MLRLVQAGKKKKKEQILLIVMFSSWLQGLWVFLVAVFVCIVVGMLVNFVFNAMYPKTCKECETRRRDATIKEAAQNASAEIDDGGEDI